MAAVEAFASVQHTTSGQPYFSFDTKEGSEPSPVLVRTLFRHSACVAAHAVPAELAAMVAGLALLN